MNDLVSQTRQPAFDLSPQTFDQALTFSNYLADSDLVPKERRASALAFYALGIPIGTLLGMIFGGGLMATMTTALLVSKLAAALPLIQTSAVAKPSQPVSLLVRHRVVFKQLLAPRSKSLKMYFPGFRLQKQSTVLTALMSCSCPARCLLRSRVPQLAQPRNTAHAQHLVQAIPTLHLANSLWLRRCCRPRRPVWMSP